MDEVGGEMVTGRVEDEIIKINQDRIISARMVDTEEEEGSQNTIRDHIPREGQQATSVRQYHAGVQYAVFVLYCAGYAR
jgi:hypothetical protein